MHDASDMDLLRDYDRQGSEAAFAELVQRHINLVYSVALRHVGIAAHAEEITQAVFIILARKAAGLRADTILEGWLHETTRLTALRFLRGERRRQFREQEAYMQSTLQENNDAATWNRLAPLLDEAVSRLGTKDRDAVVLRFFKNKNLREVAAAMNVNEAAAQRRVHRAVEKLRKFFAKRGVALSSVAITGAISANSVQAAPVALAKAVTAIAVAKGAAASASTLTLIEGALKIMAWTKTKITIAVGVGVILILAGGTTTAILKKHSAHQMLVADAYRRANLTDPKYRNVIADLRTNVWPKERLLAEEKIKARQQVNETTNAVTINLKPYANAALTDSPASRIGVNEDNLTELPPGVHIYGGVPFDVSGIIQLDGTNMMAFGKHFSAEVDHIRINQKCARLFLLHGANWIYGHDFGRTVAKLVLHYADGSAKEIEIVAGKHVFDWWSPLFTTGVDARYFQMADGTERAWSGSNPFIKKIWPDESLVLYKSTFENPQPDVVVSDLDYVSTVTGTAPFLVGLTVE